MRRHDIASSAYAAAQASASLQPQGAAQDDPEYAVRMLDAVASQAMQGKTGLEPAAQEAAEMSGGEAAGDPEPALKLLREAGYLRGADNRITARGFEAIGYRMLAQIMGQIKEPGSAGSHDSVLHGPGEVDAESTRPIGFGGDARRADASQTLLNAVQRIRKSKGRLEFPMGLLPEDFEERESYAQARAAVAYCIDLSSTMRYSLGSTTRIAAAKRALWTLYALNKKFFPADSIYIVGFASMASPVRPADIPYLQTYDARDGFLHYTNYQAALRAARKMLQKDGAQNRRIVLITDGQPSACNVEGPSQRAELIGIKPYANLYRPEPALASKILEERSLRLGSSSEVYLCYRHKQVDAWISRMTLQEARRCLRQKIRIDSVVIGDEPELLEYARGLESAVRGRTYHIDSERMDRALVEDYLYGTKRVLTPRQAL